VYQPQTTTKAGIVLYLIAFIALGLIAAVTMHKLPTAAKDDKRLAWAVIIALPFILVRLIYSIISVFSHNHQFNLITGSVTIHVVMAVLEEMAVVCIYLVAGWVTAVITSTNRGPIASRPWKGNLAGEDGARGGHGRRRRQGPIHALVEAGISAAQHNKGGEV